MQAIPEVIVSDGAGEQTGVKWREEINLIRTRQHLTEHASLWQNRAEREIGEVKRGIKRATRRSGSPKRLWDYCGQWVVAIRRMTAHDFPELDGMPPEEAVHNRMADISAYAQFDWYDMFGTSTDQRTRRIRQGSVVVGLELLRFRALQ